MPTKAQFTEMSVEFKIALRYLFSKKKQSAINIISSICAGGICVATIALVCILSVYNGFQSLVADLYSAFDPDIRISCVNSKTFSYSDSVSALVNGVDGVALSSPILEDGAILLNDSKQVSIRLCGVEQSYLKLISVDSVTYRGVFNIGTPDVPYLVVGAATAAQLETSVHFVSPVTVFTPIHDAKINLANPDGAFNQIELFVAGVYSVHQQDTDSRFAFLPISTARALFGQDSLCCTHIDIKTSKDIEKTKELLVSKLSELTTDLQFKVETKTELHAEFYKMLKVEKWITFLILFMVLMVAVVNIIGSLSMLIIEKKEDIKTLRFLGADNTMVRKVFLLEGWLISALGCLIGVVAGVVLCALQSWFGIIKLSEGGDFVVDAYPVVVNPLDVLVVLFTVLLVGGLVAWIPTKFATKQE